jgi:nucleotidyltransferase/DNA polymerase involved in DNA repair
MRLLHLHWPHLPLRLARSRSTSFPTGPLVLGGQPWEPGLVLDADPAAMAMGVRRGMPLGGAHRLAPEATSFPTPTPMPTGRP